MKLLNKYYPLYFGIFPVLLFYATNKNELSINSIEMPFVTVFVFTLIVWGSLTRLVKDKYRTKIISSLFLLYFFSYLHFHNTLKLIKPLISKFPLSYMTASFLLYTLLFILITKRALSIKQKVRFEGVLSIIGAYLIVYSLFLIVPFQLNRAAINNSLGNKAALEKTSLEAREKPDIYYIILDRYANEATLSDYFGYDNSQFTNFLENRGFFVADESFANYPKTHTSLGSSLNMDYLDKLVKKIGKNNRDYTYAFDLVQNNKVASILQSLGYRYIYFGDWWEPTRVNSHADKNINLYASSNEFMRKFFKTTVLYPLFGNYLIKNKYIGFSDDRVYQNLNYKFEKLKSIANEQSPKFVFAHMLIPHYPYLFDRNCRRVEDERKGTDDEKYIEQLKCTNKKTQAVVDAILKKSNKPPIIIIQSDEGPYKVDEMNRSGEGVDWTKVSKTAKQVHMRILNSYYVPSSKLKNKLYSSISPVNTFRMIFNYYFKAGYKLLPDRSFFIPHLDLPYNYKDITDDVTFD